MRLSQTSRIGINVVLIGISLFVWVLLLFNPGGIMTMEHCHVSSSGPSAASLDMLLEMNPISDQLLGWGLMVVAMMLPKLIMPVKLIYVSSLRRTRILHSTLFVWGYLLTWMLGGMVMVVGIIAFNLFFPLSYFPAALVFALAVIWQFSPAKQYFLNLGHKHPVLPAFGLEAAGAALMYGIKHGLWCIGSGWALMLFPMLMPEGHNAAMIVVTFIMLAEHQEHPSYPEWKLDFRIKYIRYLLFRLKGRLSA